MTKEAKIKKEKEILTEIFADVDEETLKLCSGLIDNASFMKVTLEELQNDITKQGATIKCKSGNGFDTIKDNPSQKAYTTMMARYTDVIAKLKRMLKTNAEADDELMDFIRR